jgi:hypothetical protein
MRTLTSSSSGGECRNPSFGLVTKAKGLQACKPRGRKPGSLGKGMAKLQAQKEGSSGAKAIAIIQAKKF